MRTVGRTVLVLMVSLAGPVCAAAQPDVVGTRAQGMAGAFVGVADDASAVYWNPAGLATGAYFSLVLDGNTAKAEPEDRMSAGSRGGWLLALTTPALGLSYYRLQSATVRPAAAPGTSRVESLVTQHVGATMVQSLADRLAVGATLKLVRGVAGGAEVPGANAPELLDRVDLIGRSGNKVDVDLGLMSAGAFGRIGLLVRNVTAPTFRTGDEQELQLQRQVRGGASILVLQTWKLAADADFTRRRGLFGDVRELAVGTEGQVTRRIAARGGVRFNTAGDESHGASLAAGASYAVTGAVLLDAQITTGGDKTFRGWGLAGRLVF